MKINLSRIQEHFQFASWVNSHSLEDIEWIDETGAAVTVDSQLIEDWKFMGLTNIYFPTTCGLLGETSE